MSEWGRELDEWRAQGIERRAAIERPEGRVVERESLDAPEDLSKEAARQEIADLRAF